MLGTQFDVNVLREIISILLTDFVAAKMPIINIMNGIVNNEGMKILALLMKSQDKDGKCQKISLVHIIINLIIFPFYFPKSGFQKLIDYMRTNRENVNEIDAIEKSFSDLLLE